MIAVVFFFSVALGVVFGVILDGYFGILGSGGVKIREEKIETIDIEYDRNRIRYFYFRGRWITCLVSK